MSAALVVDNLLAWSAQICVLVGIGALAALTLSHPRARLIFWQGILAIALLLPAVEPWHRPAAEAVGSVSIASGPVVVVSHPSAARVIWKREYLLWIAAMGMALRFLWIGAGLIRLRRHRLDARMLTTPPVPFANPRVRWFVSTTVGGPVTFGFLNPSILLPARILDLPQDMTAAIAHHELAHVRRRDWLFVLFEEAIRSALWFHPAVWFVLSRIQLTREQVVDAEVVGLTRDRERYLDALVAVAAQRLLPDLAPAPLFLKKRQLAVRVAAVLKETRMSKPRAFFSFTTVCSAALVAARVAIWMFPLHAPAQTPQISAARSSTVSDGPGIVVEPGAKIMHRSPVFSPPGVTASGVVIVETSVNAKGEVTDAHVVSGPEELRSVVLSSVLNWHFSTEGGLPPTVQSTIRFTSVTRAATPPPAAAPHTSNSRLKAIRMNGLSDDLAEKVRATISVQVGDPFGNDDLARVRGAVKEIDKHMMVGMGLANGEVTLTIALPPDSGGLERELDNIRDQTRALVTSTSTPPIPAAGVANFPVTPGAARVRVGGSAQATNLIKKVTPLYPPLAKQARVQGTVRFSVLIDREGKIAEIQLIEGHPLLADSAMDAVKQWQYHPTMLNGDPVEVVTVIDVNFTLTQ